MKDRLFCDRWTSVHLLERAVNARYKLEGVNTNKMAISKAIGKVEEGVQDLQTKHLSGIYGGIHTKMRLFFSQDPKLDPPYFPPTMYNKICWDKIKTLDENNLKCF